MTDFETVALAGSLLLLLVVSPSAHGAWPQSRADPQNTGSVGSVSPGDGTVAWNSTLNFSAQFAPTFAEGTVLVTAGGVSAFDVSTGFTQWTFRPAFGNFTLPSGWIETAPISDDRSVFVGTAFPSLHAVSVQDGTERWRVETENVPRSLVLLEDRLFAARDQNVTRHHLGTGTEVWSVKTAGTISDITAGGDRLYVASSGRSPTENRVYALQPSMGQEAWSRRIDSRLSGEIAVGPTAVYVGAATPGPGNPIIAALDKETGEIRWETETQGDIAGPLVWANGTVVASLASPGAERAGQVIALDADDGEIRWESEDSSGTLSVAGGIVYAGGYHLRGLSTAEGEHIRIFPHPSPVRHVSIGDGVILATSEETVYALDGGDPVHRRAPLSTAMAALSLVLASVASLVVHSWRNRG